jgi:hypothetical protein
MNLENRKRVEREIVTAVLQSAVARGCTFKIDNGGDDDEIIPTEGVEKTLEEMFATDQETLYIVKDGKEIGSVLFVYGNDGWDVIADYTTNLEDMLHDANNISDKYQ